MELFGGGRRGRFALACASAACLACACSSSSSSTTSAPSSATSTSPRPSASGAGPPGAASASAPSSTSPPPATATPSALATLSGCPAPVALSALTALAHAAGDVDDVIVTADGHAWITAVNDGRIFEFDGSGRLLRTFLDPRGPEGIVPLPGGGFAVAEQKANRVGRLDPATGNVALLLDVPNRTSNAGVDGIAMDPARSRLLVPDSANGRLLALPITASGTAGGPAQVLSTGLGRPVAAWPEADGSVDVAVENSPGLVRVAPGGGVTPLVASGVLPQVDEVLGEAGLLYVTDLTRHLVAAVDPRTGALAQLVTAAPDPQGLALMPDGRFLLVDTTTRALVVIAPCR